MPKNFFGSPLEKLQRKKSLLKYRPKKNFSPFISTIVSFKNQVTRKKAKICEDFNERSCSWKVWNLNRKKPRNLWVNQLFNLFMSLKLLHRVSKCIKLHTFFSSLPKNYPQKIFSLEKLFRKNFLTSAEQKLFLVFSKKWPKHFFGFPLLKSCPKEFLPFPPKFWKIKTSFPSFLKNCPKTLLYFLSKKLLRKFSSCFLTKICRKNYIFSFPPEKLPSIFFFLVPPP